MLKLKGNGVECRERRAIYVSGEVGVGSDGRLADGGFEAQCRQAISNIEVVLESARMTLDNVIKVTVFIIRREDLRPLQNVCATNLSVARAVIAVIVAGLHDPDWLVEIGAVAAAAT